MADAEQEAFPESPWTLVRAHLIVATVAVGALLVVAVGLWRQTDRLDLMEKRLPASEATMRLRSGLHNCVAGLRGWIAVADVGFRRERALAWEEIRSALGVLGNLDLEWAGRMDGVEVRFDELSEAQWWIEDIAHSPGNEPARVILTQDLLSTSDRMRSRASGILAQAPGPEVELMGPGLARFQAAITRCDTALTNFAVDAGVQYEHRYRSEVARADQCLRDLTSTASPVREPQRAHLRDLRRDLGAFQERAGALLAARKRVDWNVALHLLETRAVPIVRELSAILDDLAASQASLFRRELRPAGRLNRVVGRASIILCGLLVLGAGAVSIRGAGRIARPLRQLSRAAHSLGTDGSGEALPLAGPRELRELIIVFNAMRVQLHQRELELRNAVALSRSITETAADAIITIDARGKVHFFNPAAERLFGYRASEIVGHSVNPLIPAPIAGQHDAYLARYIKTRQARIIGSGREVLGQRRDGTTFSMELSVSEVTSDRGMLFTAIAHDLSERKAMERELAQRNKLEAIGQLAAGIAHEVNTPTQYVGDNTRFLQEAFTSLAPLMEKAEGLALAVTSGAPSRGLGEELREALLEADVEYLLEEVPRAVDQALEGVDRVVEIVRAMKEFSHKGTQEMKAIDVNHAIENTVTVARNEWKYVADLELDLAEEMAAVTCLGGPVNQVLLNLVINAAHAIEEANRDAPEVKGVITISTRQHGEDVEIRVADSGTGIPEHVRENVFDPFFTTKDVGKGTGQGLAMAHDIVVKQHGGTLSFETDLGRGTTFIVRLPINQVSIVGAEPLP